LVDKAAGNASTWGYLTDEELCLRRVSGEESNFKQTIVRRLEQDGSASPHTRFDVREARTTNDDIHALGARSKGADDESAQLYVNAVMFVHDSTILGHHCQSSGVYAQHCAQQAAEAQSVEDTHQRRCWASG